MCDEGKKTVVLDLDETLVHSSFSPLSVYDIVIPLSSGQAVDNVYVCVRPGVHEFLQSLSSQFEIIVFTAGVKEVSIKY